MKSIDRLMKKTSPIIEQVSDENQSVDPINNFLSNEIWKILKTDLTYLEKCFVIAILVKLNGKRVGVIKMENLRKELNISLNGYKNKNTLRKKGIFTFKAIALTGTEVEYFGVDHLNNYLQE